MSSTPCVRVQTAGTTADAAEMHRIDNPNATLYWLLMVSGRPRISQDADHIAVRDADSFVVCGPAPAFRYGCSACRGDRSGPGGVRSFLNVRTSRLVG